MSPHTHKLQQQQEQQGQQNQQQGQGATTITIESTQLKIINVKLDRIIALLDKER
jgi:hypothetical protein